MDCSVCGKPVRAHEAGRELDLCVALKRGWTEVKKLKYYNSLKGINPDGMEEIVASWSEPGVIAATWELVEYIVGKGGRVKIEKYSDGWYVNFTTDKPIDGTGWLVSQEETETIAISRAFIAS